MDILKASISIIAMRMTHPKVGLWAGKFSPVDIDWIKNILHNTQKSDNPFPNLAV